MTGPNIFQKVITNKWQNVLCTQVQSEERQIGLRTSSWTLDTLVISQQKWLKFGFQAHFFNMFGHTKQLSITF